MEAAQVGLGHVTNKSHVTCSTLHWPPPSTSAELSHVTRAAVPCNEPTHHRIPRVSPTQPSPPLTIKTNPPKGCPGPSWIPGPWVRGLCPSQRLDLVIWAELDNLDLQHVERWVKGGTGNGPANEIPPPPPASVLPRGKLENTPWQG